MSTAGLTVRWRRHQRPVGGHANARRRPKTKEAPEAPLSSERGGGRQLPSPPDLRWPISVNSRAARLSSWICSTVRQTRLEFRVPVTRSDRQTSFWVGVAAGVADAAGAAGAAVVAAAGAAGASDVEAAVPCAGAAPANATQNSVVIRADDFILGSPWRIDTKYQTPYACVKYHSTPQRARDRVARQTPSSRATVSRPSR